MCVRVGLCMYGLWGSGCAYGCVCKHAHVRMVVWMDGWMDGGSVAARMWDRARRCFAHALFCVHAPVRPVLQRVRFRHARVRACTPTCVLVTAANATAPCMQRFPIREHVACYLHASCCILHVRPALLGPGAVAPHMLHRICMLQLASQLQAAPVGG